MENENSSAPSRACGGLITHISALTNFESHSIDDTCVHTRTSQSNAYVVLQGKEHLEGLGHNTHTHLQTGALRNNSI